MATSAYIYSTFSNLAFDHAIELLGNKLVQIALVCNNLWGLEME